MGSFGVYVLWQGQNTPSSYVASAPVDTQTTTSSNTNTAPISDTAPAPADQTTTVPVAQTTNSKKVTAPVPVSKKVSVPPPVPKKSGIYTDGTYTGSVADAYYGNVQVEAVITNSKISNVIFLDYPHDRSTSVRINSRATPLLTQEAISAQSANVNGVSGASDTSAAFRQSLASALNQARA